MQYALQITFRGMDPSTFVEGRARELAQRLERFQDRITSCRATIHSPHQHHRKGQQFDVSLRVGVPGGEVTVDHTNEDLYVALRDAFDAVVRKLDDRAGRLDPRARRLLEHRRTG